MKKERITMVLTLTAMIILSISCSESESITDTLNQNEKSGEMSAIHGELCTYDGELSDAEIKGLLNMREEEKLARDIYLKLYETHNLIIFQNIANSENAHTSAIKKLLDGYNIEDCALEEQGKFSNSVFTELYNSLTAQGFTSEIEALKTGAYIEDLDIADLKKLLAENKNIDVERVYTNLLKGSENHMRAFISALDNLGESYSPRFISTEDFDDILTSENEQGNGNGNKGMNSRENCDGTQTGSATGSGNQNGTTKGNRNGGARGNSIGNGRG